MSIGEGYINIDGNSYFKLNIFLENWNNITQRINDCVYIVAKQIFGDNFKGLPIIQKESYRL